MEAGRGKRPISSLDKERRQEGGKRANTNRNQQALSAPSQVQGPHVSDKTQFRSQGLEPAGARSGLGWVWFVIGRLPPS